MSGISRYKPFWKPASSAITSGRVHLDVCCIDRSTSLPSVANVAHPSVTHLGGHAHLWCQRWGRFSKRLETEPVYLRGCFWSLPVWAPPGWPCGGRGGGPWWCSPPGPPAPTWGSHTGSPGSTAERRSVQNPRLIVSSVITAGYWHKLTWQQLTFNKHRLLL